MLLVLYNLQSFVSRLVLCKESDGASQKSGRSEKFALIFLSRSQDSKQFGGDRLDADDASHWSPETQDVSDKFFVVKRVHLYGEPNSSCAELI